MVLFFSIFFTLYAAINYYIFIRGWQALVNYPHFKIFYLVIFIIVSLSYIAAKFLVNYLPRILYDGMLWIGSFWFAFILYFFLAIVFIDLLRLANHWFNFFPQSFEQNYIKTKEITALIVVVIITLTVAAGFINSRNLKVRTLNLIIPKGSSSLTELNAAVVSDIHLSPMDNASFLKNIINKINKLNPDVVLLPGDIVDDKPKVLRERGIGNNFREIKSKYGVYASTGNHEFITGVKESVKFMEDYGIVVLRDSAIKIDEGFYIAARDDRSINQFSNEKRASLETILENVDKNFPVILMDHTPFGLEDAEKNNVDLQLSGHTHHGQMWPNNIITNMIYKVSWGYLKLGNTQYYVSCGAGTWGPPVRLGSDSEIINLKIKFE